MASMMGMPRPNPSPRPSLVFADRPPVLAGSVVGVEDEDVVAGLTDVAEREEIARLLGAVVIVPEFVAATVAVLDMEESLVPVALPEPLPLSLVVGMTAVLKVVEAETVAGDDRLEVRRSLMENRAEPSRTVKEVVQIGLVSGIPFASCIMARAAIV
ncbi:hypothetical protein LTR86_006425 [Recurvomyces mirabilis]|nr:hypothetical protein LTR86_006425 [Recurvomyces mirabilis]